MPRHNTNYNGPVVDEATATALKNSPVSEFLSIEKNPNETYSIQAKFPEWGRHNGRDFRIRENLNYFLRGLARSCLDENGVFDIDKAARVSDDLVTTLPHGRVSEAFAESCGIPDNRADDFARFVQTYGIMLDMMRFRFDLEVENLQSFKHDVNTVLAEPGINSADPRFKLVDESFDDYRNTLAKYERMANMDPQTETGVLLAAECADYAGWNYGFMEANNAYRQRHGQPQNVGNRLTINFAQNFPEAREEDRYLKYKSHACFVLETRIGNEPTVISIEATAPPSGKLMFCPKDVRSGVGIYNNTQELEAFHTAEPYTKIADFDLYESMKNPRQAANYVRKADASDEFLAIRLNEAFADLKAAADALTPEENERAFERADQQAFRAQAAAEVIAEMTEAAVAGRGEDAEDARRLTTKEILGTYANRYARSVPDDEKLNAILDKVRSYAAMNVSAVESNYEKEIAAYNALYADVKDYYETLDALQIGIAADPERGIEGFNPELPENRTRYQIAADLYNFFEGQRDGDLVFNSQRPEVGAAIVDGRAFPMLNHGSDKRFIDVSDRPLFPHEPCPNDISQGRLGDCYLLAGLASLSDFEPQRIRDCIRDNNDGTVTVRFYTQDLNENTGKSTGYRPVYVTVDKKIPEERGADSCLWAQMIERAYTASGLHLTADAFARPVPSRQTLDLDQEYERLLNLSPEERPSHGECPWLVDTNGNLHRWTPDYADIESGNPLTFLGQLLGEAVTEERHTLKNIAEESAAIPLDDAPGYLAGCATLKLLGEKATQEDTELALRNQVYGAMTVGQFLYRAMRPEEQVPMLNNGTFNANDSELADVCRAFGILLTKSIPQDVDLDTLSRAQMKATLTDSVHALQKLLENAEAPDVDETLREQYAQFLVTANKTPELLAFLKDTYLPAMEMHVDDSANLVAMPDAYSGEYSGVMNEVYDTIERNVRLGYPTTAATPGETDTKRDTGILNKHAYSVLGVTHKTLGGHELKFVKLRNPHGWMGREYYEENGTVKFREQPDAPGGVFEMELGDFCKEFTAYHSACIGKAQPVPAAENGADQPAEDRFVGDTLSNYGRALSGVMSTLDRTGRDSKEFKDLYKAVKRLVEEDYLSKYRGKTLKEMANDPAIKDIPYLCRKYENHCLADKKFFHSDRRDNRLEQAKQLKKITEALTAGCKDPKDHLAKALVDKMMSDNQTYVSLSEENKEQQIRVFVDSKQFQLMKKSLSFSKLSKLSEKPAIQILQAWQEVGSSLLKKEFNRQPQAANPAANPAINAPAGPNYR